MNLLFKAIWLTGSWTYTGSGFNRDTPNLVFSILSIFNLQINIVLISYHDKNWSGKFLKIFLTVENSNLNLKTWPLEFRKIFQGADLKFIGGDWRELYKFYISGLKMIIKNLVHPWKITKDNRFMINHPKILNLTVYNHMFLNN